MVRWATGYLLVPLDPRRRPRPTAVHHLRWEPSDRLLWEGLHRPGDRLGPSDLWQPWGRAPARKRPPESKSPRLVVSGLPDSGLPAPVGVCGVAELELGAAGEVEGEPPLPGGNRF